MHVWKPKGGRAHLALVASTAQHLEQEGEEDKVLAGPKWPSLHQSTTSTASMLALYLDHQGSLTIHSYISQRLVPDTGVEALSVLSSRLDPELPQPPHATLHEAFFFSYSSHNPQGGMHTGWPIDVLREDFLPKPCRGTLRG